MVVDTLARFLDGSCDIVETLADGSRVRDTVRRLEPDVVILDISMPNTSGLEVLRQIAEDGASC